MESSFEFWVFVGGGFYVGFTICAFVAYKSDKFVKWLRAH